MKDEYIVIDINNKERLLVVPQVKCSRFNVYYDTFCTDGFGRNHRVIKILKSYNSIEDMEADVGFLMYCEYDDEIKEDDEHDEHDYI